MSWQRLLGLEANLVLHRRLVEVGDEWALFAGIVRVLIVDHIGLRIVLLFCTHGINLGRT